jgi:hypothetical protein
VHYLISFVSESAEPSRIAVCADTGPEAEFFNPASGPGPFHSWVRHLCSGYQIGRKAGRGNVAGAALGDDCVRTVGAGARSRSADGGHLEATDPVSTHAGAGIARKSVQSLSLVGDLKIMVLSDGDFHCGEVTYPCWHRLALGHE